MIILVTFIIFVLIIFITHKSSKDNIAENPNYREKYFWQDENKAYSLLLHSVTINDRLFSAYSHKFDSFITFPFSDQDYKILQNKLDKLPHNTRNCNSCHEYEGY